MTSSVGFIFLSKKGDVLVLPFPIVGHFPAKQSSISSASITIELMDYPWEETLPALLESSLQKRLPLLEDQSAQALRLFNGFLEGFPFLSSDLYHQTVVLYVNKLLGEESDLLVQSARDFYLIKLPAVKCVIAKHRSSENPLLKQGELVFGTAPDTQITENGIYYALDLLMNQDASFYPDTRNLRQWLTSHAKGKTALNTFAYTGSLGIAALAGGVSRVVQVDRNSRFLNLARKSLEMNHLETARMKLISADFFVVIGQMKRRSELYDMVILDPPYFSSTDRGQVKQAGESTRLINKVRPLVRDGGHLVVVNNALFYSGRAFMDELEALCASGYLSLEETIPVPPDITGFMPLPVNIPADPAPFNHSTKIAVLKVKRKD
jgi:23S rRNA (cytosine1962-C5)-methyltransferase